MYGIDDVHYPEVTKSKFLEGTFWGGGENTYGKMYQPTFVIWEVIVNGPLGFHVPATILTCKCR